MYNKPCLTKKRIAPPAETFTVFCMEHQGRRAIFAVRLDEETLRLLDEITKAARFGHRATVARAAFRRGLEAIQAEQQRQEKGRR